MPLKFKALWYGIPAAYIVGSEAAAYLSGQASSYVVGKLYNGFSAMSPGSSLRGSPTSAPTGAGLDQMGGSIGIQSATPEGRQGSHGGQQPHYQQSTVTTRARSKLKKDLLANQAASTTASPLKDSYAKRRPGPLDPEFEEVQVPMQVLAPSSAKGAWFSPWAMAFPVKRNQARFTRPPGLPPSIILRGGNPYLNNMYWPGRGGSSYVRSSRRRRRF